MSLTWVMHRHDYWTVITWYICRQTQLVCDIDCRIFLSRTWQSYWSWKQNWQWISFRKAIHKRSEILQKLKWDFKPLVWSYCWRHNSVSKDKLKKKPRGMDELPSSVCSQSGIWSITGLIIYMLTSQLTWMHFQLILVCWNLYPHYSLCYQHLQHFRTRSNNGTVAIFYEAIIMALVKLKGRNVIKGRIYAQEYNHDHFFSLSWLKEYLSVSRQI